jgi:hypothetical protein
MQNSSNVARIGDELLRVKGKEARSEIEKLSKDEKENGQVRLRAFLSIGKMPPPDLISEDNIAAALALDDRVNFFPKLATTSKLITAEAPLYSILRGMKDVGARRALRITRNLSRTIAKWQKERGPIALGDTSLQLLIKLLAVLLKYQVMDASMRSSSRPLKLHPYLQMLSAILRWTLCSENPETISLTLQLINSAEEAHLVSLTKLEEDEFGKNLQEIVAIAIKQCESFVRKDSAFEFRELAQAVLRISGAGDKLRRRLIEIYSDRARLSAPVQNALRELLGHAVEPVTFPGIPVDDEDSIQTVQLASALMGVWVARKDSQKSSEAFEEFRSVAKNFFHLHLRGEEGQVEDYNPRVHELIPDAKRSAKVRLLGPWIEFSRQSVAKVILKAPAEPA